jgi:DNA-nicking Smr family endonuclease
MVTVKSLADLKQVKKEIEAQAKRDAERKAEEARLARQATADKDLFLKAAGPVKALQQPPKAVLKKEPPRPIPLQRQLDEQAALQEALSDAFDASTLLDTDEHLSYRRPGVGPDVTRKLRRGDWAIQRQLDLHGLRTDEAREQLGQFIREAHRQGLRCVRVVHGKGLGSPGKTPVLKGRVQSWLAQKKEVLAFVQARPAEGGAGALVVLLQPAS